MSCRKKKKNNVTGSRRSNKNAGELGEGPAAGMGGKNESEANLYKNQRKKRVKIRSRIQTIKQLRAGITSRCKIHNARSVIEKDLIQLRQKLKKISMGGAMKNGCRRLVTGSKILVDAQSPLRRQEIHHSSLTIRSPGRNKRSQNVSRTKTRG